MLWQLRSYRVHPGQMDEFVAFWRDHVVPAREALGYKIEGAWRGEEDDDAFVWLVGHEAPNGWAAAERAYYESPERAALPRDPREFLTEVQTTLLRAAV